ncbi:MAG: ribonuclease R [Clostridia bacterium]|nr:ribonuclease R [Clostridia bacterium]
MKHSEKRRNKVAAFLASDRYIPMSLDELCLVLDVPDSDREEFKNMLEEMKQAGILNISKKGRYTITENKAVHKGKIQGTARRFSFFIPESEGIEDIFIAPDKLHGAMHGDSVLARVIPSREGDNRLRGEVVQILNEQRDEILGVIEIYRAALTVVPFDKRIGRIRIESDQPQKFREGDVAAVEVGMPSAENTFASGKIKEIIAKRSDPRSLFKYITRMYGYETEYPADVAAEAKSISARKEDYGDRIDYRGLTTITIDGDDAKDLDDAISISRKDNGNYMLGVHIADVSHYVRENSLLDKEAADRGTSVYLVDRVIPMLPEVLSNGLCSLNPNEDKLAFSVMMEVNDNGIVIDFDINESIINSDERMTYKNVYKLLNGEDDSLAVRYAHIMDELKTMRELAALLRKKRRARGSIDFDFKESKVIMGPDGIPADITKYDITEANRIIEEFMLLCNETVAENFGWGDFPFIFRVDDNPDQEKMFSLSNFLKGIGRTLKSPGNVHPAELQRLIDSVKGSPVEHLVNLVVLRSLKKAEYSPVNNGHFGLSSEHYCHFTSPIRRYPDLMIHRLIKKKLGLGGEKAPEGPKAMDILAAHVFSIAKSSSEMERRAEQAERDLVDRYKAAYMEQHIGETFTGVVSGVTGFGMFVELENTVEGLVKLGDLDGYYIYDRDNHELYMENGPGRYTIGTQVRVQVVSVNINAGEVDMIIPGGKRMPKRHSSRRYSKENRRRRKKNY